VYIVVSRATSALSSRPAQRASLSSGWAVTSRSLRTVLRSSASASPAGPTSSDPNGMSPARRAAAASSIARLRLRSSASTTVCLLDSLLDIRC
jgi:hypothetical protein